MFWADLLGGLLTYLGIGLVVFFIVYKRKEEDFKEQVEKQGILH